MATFTITTSQNIDALTSKAGGDLYNVNGGILTIDQDSRVGLNQTTSTTLWSITLSASLGGAVNIDGRWVWMIPYSWWTGNVPAWNTVITNGTGTWKLIGVHSSLTAASTATGAAMPATGFIRVKQKTGIYAAWALTWIGATADDKGRVWWLEIAWDEASTINANRLWTFNITWGFYEIGTTNGTSNQTMQIPNNGLLRYCAGVFIRKDTWFETYNLTGWYSSIEVVSAGNQSLASWELAPIRLSLNTTNFIEFLITNNTVYARKTIAWVNTNITTIAYNSTTMKFFRIRESSGTTYWDYSQDGISWTNITNQSNPIAVTALYYGMIWWNWWAEASTTLWTLRTFEIGTNTGIAISDSFSSTLLDLNLWNTWGTLWDQEWGVYQIRSSLTAQYSGLDHVKAFEFYPNAGTTTTTGTDATRGKVVWIDANGLVRIGNSGVATNGYTPVTGLKVVVGNIFFENCTTAARTANVIPNATIATRYDFTTTGWWVVNIDKCNMAWYLSCSQAYSVQISNSGFVDAILISEVASPMTFSKVGVGNKPTTALLTNPLTMTYCYAGGTFTDCVWARVSMAASGAHIIVLTDVDWFIFIRNTIRANTIRGNATTYALIATRAKNITYIEPTIIQWALALITCDNFNTTDVKFASCVSGTTVTTYTDYVWNLSSNTINCTFSGLTLPVTSTAPYTALLIGATGCSNIKLRNIGTRATPLSLDAGANDTGLIYTIGTNCQNFRFKRIYVSNTRTGIMTGDNSCKNITEENVFGDYADAVDVMAVLNMKRKGMWGTGALTAQTSVYGTHWRDWFTSTTAGRIAILMNEPTVDTTAQVTLANGAAFTSAGGLYMPVIGHTATFEMPNYIKGHTAFTNTALVMAGGTATNYTYEYAIDKNDGAWFSAMTASNYTATTLGTALSGITGINASNGFKLKIKITTGTTNATAITSVYITTVSTTTAQDYQYPLDTINLSLTWLVSWSDIVILEAGTETELVNVDANAWSSYTYTYETPENVDIGIFKEWYIPYYVRNYILTSSDASLPIAQVADRAYLT